MTHRGRHAVYVVTLISVLLVPVCSFGDDNTALHAGLSAVFGAAGESVLHYRTELGPGERIILGTIIGSLPGLAKELADSGEENNHFSSSDMAANVAGAFLGAVIANIVNTQIRVSIDTRAKKATAMIAFGF